VKNKPGKKGGKLKTPLFRTETLLDYHQKIFFKELIPILNPFLGACALVNYVTLPDGIVANQLQFFKYSLQGEFITSTVPLERYGDFVVLEDGNEEAGLKELAQRCAEAYNVLHRNALRKGNIFTDGNKLVQIVLLIPNNLKFNFIESQGSIADPSAGKKNYASFRFKFAYLVMEK